MRDSPSVPGSGATFLSGPAGAGKTTRAAARLEELLRAGVPGRSILVLAPQRSLLRSYRAVLRKADLPPAEAAVTWTLGGMARHAVELGWPVVAERAGFRRPERGPTFLSLEAAQFYMKGIVDPLVERERYFQGVTVPRNRILNQLLDGLNKSALMGFPVSEIGPRLADSWTGEEARRTIFREVQGCVDRFREHCLDHNLLDFSLQVEVFRRHFMETEWGREILLGGIRHLIADNVEEEPPAAHDVIRLLIPRCASALIVHDEDAGYRTFQGADPEGAAEIRAICRHRLSWPDSRVVPGEIRALETRLARAMGEAAPSSPPEGAPLPESGTNRLFPQMLESAADRVLQLVRGEGIPPSEIVLLAPYVSDVLRFSLTDRLARRGIEVRSRRPSRALAEEPVTRALLAWAALAHPAWGMPPHPADLAHALTGSVEGLDPVRAHLLAHWSRNPMSPEGLRPFGEFPPEVRGRVGARSGSRYERLRTWIEAYRQGPPLFLDHFLSRLFGDVLSQPGFGFHAEARQGRFDRSRLAAHLIASAARFRRTIAVAPPPDGETDPMLPPSGLSETRAGRAFVEMVRDGLIAAQEREADAGEPPNAVLLAPATTFLLENRAVTVQIWLNAGSPGWWERPYQPLTHPYVLTRRWPRGRPWTDADEVSSRKAALLRLVRGLLRRCRRRVILAFSVLDERGFEERGPLLDLMQQIYRHESGDRR